MSLHDDRHDFEDERADRATRDEAEACVEAIDAMRQRIRDFVRTEANLLALTYPRCIDLKDYRNPSFPLQIDEAIEGFVEIVSDSFGDLLDRDEVTRQRNIAENGFDD